MISEMDPLLRLELLRMYIFKWIDRYPSYNKTFTEYLHKSHSDKIPGTLQFCVARATHCYYCDALFPKVHLSGDPKRKTSDHYYPKSLGATERYVVCCNMCNSHKNSMTPDVLVSKVTRAVLRGQTLWGYHTKQLKLMSERIQKITNDMLYNMGPRIYYIQK